MTRQTAIEIDYDSIALVDNVFDTINMYIETFFTQSDRIQISEVRICQ